MRVTSGNVVSAALLGVALLLSPPALARPYMPGELKKFFDMPCAPTCNVCHLTSAGGGVAPKPFIMAWKSAPFFFDVYDPDHSDDAASFKSSGIDSDGDLVPDADELQEGLDPNVAGPATLCGPEYGCARIESRGHVDGIAGAASAAVLVLGASLLRRRRVR